MAKSLTKKTKAPANDRLPGKFLGNAKCRHADGKGCFKVVYTDAEGTNMAQHWPDEGGAVLAAMRTSREQELDVQVSDPNGKVFATFHPRKYDWRYYAQALRFMMSNEGRNYTGDIFDIVNKEHARLRREGMDAVLGKPDTRPKAIHADIAVDALLDGKKRKPLKKVAPKKSLTKKKVT